jgi:hypothetical protein
MNFLGFCIDDEQNANWNKLDFLPLVSAAKRNVRLRRLVTSLNLNLDVSVSLTSLMTSFIDVRGMIFLEI